MSALPPLRSDLGLGEGYHSPQVEVEVRPLSRYDRLIPA